MGGVLGILKDGDDRRIFHGFEIFDTGMFLGRKTWKVFFFGWPDLSKDYSGYY